MAKKQLFKLWIVTLAFVSFAMTTGCEFFVEFCEFLAKFREFF